MLSLSLFVRLSVCLSPFLMSFEVCSTFEMSLGIKECHTDTIGVNFCFKGVSKVFEGCFKGVSRKFKWYF